MIYKKNLVKKMKKEIKLSLITENDIEFLYSLLKERLDYSDDLDKINPDNFPTFEQHSKIIHDYLDDDKYNIYKSWYLILGSNENNDDEKIGSIVLKKSGEWGYHILKNHWNIGIGQMALEKLMGLHRDSRFIARIKPENKKAIHIAEKFGHKLTELTYVKEPED